MKLLRKYAGRPTRKNITESALIEKADHFPTTVQFEDNDEKQELLAELDLLEQHLALSKNGIEEVKAKRIIERIGVLTEKEDLISKNYRN